MLKESELIGAFSLSRQEVRPFTDKQMNSCRTLRPRQSSPSRIRGCSMNFARERRVEKLNQHLEQRVTDQVGEIERMSRLRRFLPRRWLI